MRHLIIGDIVKLLEGVNIDKLHLIKCFIEGIKK